MRVTLGGSATQRRDLRTGRTIWMERGRNRLDVGPFSRSIKCDVAVVGAGISGALIAEMLSEAGLDVVVLDRRGPAVGSTAASTALLQYELDIPLCDMTKRIGKTRATRIWRRSRLAVDALRARTDRLGLDVEAATRPSLYLDGKILDPAGLADEADARRDAGFEVELIGPAETERRYGIKGRHGLMGFGNYSADPRRMAAAYLAVAETRGARVYAPAEVVGIDACENGVTLEIAGRGEVRAASVIFATGYEMLKGIPRKGNFIMSTWVIATRPQPKAIWPDAAMIWEASDPYLYICTTPGGAVICGGEDEEFESAEARDAKIAKKTAILTRKLGALLPSIEPTPAFAWAGSFGNNPLGIPTIGRVPRMPNCYAAMGYGGNGITFSMMAAQILRSTLCGKGDSDGDLFGFNRNF
ncbi:glycine/D-amino acid oxidase-like deaminating enzyme [Sphingopyxis sp. OAS728]|uniref:NAD(P)/FAD-dependent oxidoreductase n=1 Tax=Sphingopyxis sp. OAS728 TaxID=2663823 RepID=UPI001788F61C|nr:FAD-binding oxidoreductase [Sphingopyxis sp. OAS728]MBE1529682.1 glycine/D-amino acid oxidase-like deaminating enzyme [Sphingopyxis sp. OAS728]